MCTFEWANITNNHTFHSNEMYFLTLHWLSGRIDVRANESKTFHFFLTHTPFLSSHAQSLSTDLSSSGVCWPQLFDFILKNRQIKFGRFFSVFELHTFCVCVCEHVCVGYRRIEFKQNDFSIYFIFNNKIRFHTQSETKVKPNKHAPYQPNEEKKRFLQSQTCDITKENDKNSIIYGHV